MQNITQKWRLQDNKPLLVLENGVTNENAVVLNLKSLLTPKQAKAVRSRRNLVAFAYAWLMPREKELIPSALPHQRTWNRNK